MKQLPPLIQLMEGRRVRPRKAPRVRPREIKLHMAVAGTLRAHVALGWRWGHYPAGELRDVCTASKLKAMGTMPGWPDFLLFAPRGGCLHALELKRVGEDLSDDQEAFQTWCIAHGVPHAVARTTDDALAVLMSWGCLRIKSQVGTKSVGRPEGGAV